MKGTSGDWTVGRKNAEEVERPGRSLQVLWCGVQVCSDGVIADSKGC